LLLLCAIIAFDFEGFFNYNGDKEGSGVLECVLHVVHEDWTVRVLSILAKKFEHHAKLNGSIIPIVTGNRHSSFRVNVSTGVDVGVELKSKLVLLAFQGLALPEGEVTRLVMLRPAMSSVPKVPNRVPSLL
jgi:hypothetical protein